MGERRVCVRFFRVRSGMTRQRREYGPHFPGGTRCPQRVANSAALPLIFASSAICLPSLQENPIHLRAIFPQKISRGIASSNV
jgi:hypothetical protein